MDAVDVILVEGVIIEVMGAIGLEAQKELDWAEAFIAYNALDAEIADMERWQPRLTSPRS